jgi:hypothetical protein
MNKVYYKGESYHFKTFISENGTRQYLLYKDDVLKHFVEEHELDRRPLISIIRAWADKEILNSPSV